MGHFQRICLTIFFFDCDQLLVTYLRDMTKLYKLICERSLIRRHFFVKVRMYRYPIQAGQMSFLWQNDVCCQTIICLIFCYHLLLLTFNCENIARTVNGSVGDIKAPKYSVSKNVKLEANDSGISWTQPYINDPITKAESAVPTTANVSMAPRFLKKYF